MFYIVYWVMEGAKNTPLRRSYGMLLISLLHAGPVEFLYYWFHQALHHHFLYSRYHSHHHSSIVTQLITAVIHPFAEHIVYSLLFAIALVTAVVTGTTSIAAMAIYVTYGDFMNNMGHCNFEVIPKWRFEVFPPLKYLMYTSSFHSLHHTQFRINYSLFMPFYDYIYGTMDESSDSLYEKSLEKPEDAPDVVHLTHLTTPESVYHLRLGFASLSSNPLTSKWYLWLMWPVTLWSMIMAYLCGRTFIGERNTFEKLKLQIWAVPRFTIQVQFISQEEAILEAEDTGIKVVSLGLLNQDEELNRNVEAYLEKFPKLKVKLVDGSSVAAAVVLNSIPEGTSRVFFRGNLSKVAYAMVSELCHKGIQVIAIRKDEHEKLRKSLRIESRNNLPFAPNTTCDSQVWIVGQDVVKSEQSIAEKGTVFIPFSQFPPKKTREDCIYFNTPALMAPKSFGNLHACENCLPRRAISAWISHGFLPLPSAK